MYFTNCFVMVISRWQIAVLMKKTKEEKGFNSLNKHSLYFPLVISILIILYLVCGVDSILNINSE